MTPQEAKTIRMQQRCGGWQSPKIKLIGVPNTRNPYWYPGQDNEGDNIDYE